MKIKPFNKMTQAQQRVTIARDVLAQIKAAKLIPQHMCYFQTGLDRVNQQTLKNKRANCTACEIGALFASTVRINNEFDQKYGFFDAFMMRQVIGKFFSENQMTLLENCFEGFSEKGRSFHKKYKSATDVMVAIQKNIIRNRGTFKP